jgi:hypothetical protein
MLDQCGEYVERVNTMTDLCNVGKFGMDGEEYRERMNSIDRSRSTVHNSLIANVKLVNRLCGLYGLEPLFLGDPEDRIEVAEFAMAVVAENFTNRKK